MGAGGVGDVGGEERGAGTKEGVTATPVEAAMGGLAGFAVVAITHSHSHSLNSKVEVTEREEY